MHPQDHADALQTKLNRLACLLADLTSAEANATQAGLLTIARNITAQRGDVIALYVGTKIQHAQAILDAAAADVINRQ